MPAASAGLPPAVNTLKDMDAEHGYWIKAKAGISPTLRIVGEKLAEDHPIQLNAGWNLVSYLPRASLPEPSSVTARALSSGSPPEIIRKSHLRL